jgi:hypothetical protein
MLFYMNINIKANKQKSKIVTAADRKHKDRGKTGTICGSYSSGFAKNRGKRTKIQQIFNKNA